MKHFFTKIPLLCFLCTAPAFVFSQSYVPDTLFATNGQLNVAVGPSILFSNFAEQSDGHIIQGGQDLPAAGYYNVMLRFDACGRIDSSFGTNGLVYHHFAVRNQGFHYALQQDGKILVCGIQAATSAGSAQIPFVARYNGDGSPDTTFGDTGVVAKRFDAVSSGGFYRVMEMADGRILCMGMSSSNANGGLHGFGAMRFHHDGTPDSTFDADGIARLPIGSNYNPARGRLLQDGRIIVAGRYTDGLSVTHFAATAFDSTGALDTSFAVAGVFTDSVSIKDNFADAYLDIQSDDKLVMACDRPVAADGMEVIRFTPAGLLDSTFGTGGHVQLIVPNMSCSGIRVLMNGQILILGGYSLGSTKGCAVRLHADGSVDTTFGTNSLQLFNLNNGTASHKLFDILEQTGNRLLAGADDSRLLAGRFITQSNVPHISGNGLLLHTTGSGTYQWLLNDTAIAGATADTLVPAVDGTYKVELTDDLGCTMRSAGFVVIGTATHDPGPNGGLHVVNPFRTRLDITLPDGLSQPVTYAVYDVSGRIRIQGTADPRDGKHLLLETGTLSTGIYLIHLESGTTRYRCRALKSE